ncbi:undecaprenyl-diphosphatase UppP [Kamptonema cortianum]|nr:undecaprenyl-diphosphatase UppP [Geitlerinema splendidum]MDK3158681.1 undecaprenyl-diphosphatase UppP [Kamptonema cortianum]
MDLVQAIILGLVQGATEFLPISSSGHLFLIPAFAGWEDAGAGFTAVIQLGTLLAVFIYFWRDLAETTSGWISGLSNMELRDSQAWRLGNGILLGSIPIALAGLLLESEIDTAFRSPYIIAATLAGFGLLMGLADWKGKRTREISNFKIKDGLIMGLWQCLALIPGSSRSGCTITGGLFAGFDRATAARASFLLSVPSIFGSGVYKLIKERDNLLGEGLIPTIVSTSVAFLSGWLAIAFLMKFLQTRSTALFVAYRVILAGVTVLFAMNQMSA